MRDRRLDSKPRKAVFLGPFGALTKEQEEWMLEDPIQFGLAREAAKGFIEFEEQRCMENGLPVPSKRKLFDSFLHGWYNKGPGDINT